MKTNRQTRYPPVPNDLLELPAKQTDMTTTTDQHDKTGMAPDSSITLVDADVHCQIRSIEDLMPYLPNVWQHYIHESGLENPGKSWYPKVKRSAARDDAHPPNGVPPGSDLAFTQKQHLDYWKIDRAIMNPLYGADFLYNADLSAALCAAYNDFMIEHWYEKDKRLYGSMMIPWRDADLAVREIERIGSHPRILQIILHMTPEVLWGQRPFHPIWAAAEKHNLVLGIHWGGYAPPRATGGAAPSFYMEFHTTEALAAMAHIASFVCEGVFQKFPALKVAIIEGGMAWLPALMWRLDKDWRGCRMEVPWLTESPSKLIRRHIRLTTQPIEEPENPKHLLETINHMGSDNMLLFATDYPHWDFDSPAKALPRQIPKPLQKRIFADNAIDFYGLT